MLHKTQAVQSLQQGCARLGLPSSTALALLQFLSAKRTYDQFVPEKDRQLRMSPGYSLHRLWHYMLLNTTVSSQVHELLGGVVEHRSTDAHDLSDGTKLLQRLYALNVLRLEGQEPDTTLWTDAGTAMHTLYLTTSPVPALESLPGGGRLYVTPSLTQQQQGQLVQALQGLYAQEMQPTRGELPRPAEATAATAGHSNEPAAAAAAASFKPEQKTAAPTTATTAAAGHGTEPAAAAATVAAAAAAAGAEPNRKPAALVAAAAAVEGCSTPPAPAPAVGATAAAAAGHNTEPAPAAAAAAQAATSTSAAGLGPGTEPAAAAERCDTEPAAAPADTAAAVRLDTESAAAAAAAAVTAASAALLAPAAARHGNEPAAAAGCGNTSAAVAPAATKHCREEAAAAAAVPAAVAAADIGMEPAAKRQRVNVEQPQQQTLWITLHFVRSHLNDARYEQLEPRRDVQFHVKPSTHMGRVLKAFADRVSWHPDALRLVFDGQRVPRDATPQDLGIEDGDVIDVFPS